MYAIIKTGGKQYKAVPGAELMVERIAAETDSQVTLSDVLMVVGENTFQLGAPLLSHAHVKATVMAQGRGPKLCIFKMRRRKHYRKHQGHRQHYTTLRIDEIIV